MQSLLVPNPEETVPTGASNAPVDASAMSPTQPEMIHALCMRIILDSRDASTVPSMLDLLTLMDQDCSIVKGFTPLCPTWAAFDDDGLTYLHSGFHQRYEPTR